MSKDEVWSGMRPQLHSPWRDVPGTAASLRALQAVISPILSDEEAVGSILCAFLKQSVCRL